MLLTKEFQPTRYDASKLRAETGTERLLFTARLYEDNGALFPDCIDNKGVGAKLARSGIIMSTEVDMSTADQVQVQLGSKHLANQFLERLNVWLGVKTRRMKEAISF